MKNRRRGRKDKKDLLTASVSAGLTPDMKLALTKIKKTEGTSYAALVRFALRNTYPYAFDNKVE